MSTSTPTPKPDLPGDTASATPRPANGRSRGAQLLAALPWIGPAILLIVAVVLFPAGYMAYNSTRSISQSGVDRGPAGLENYETLFSFAPLVRILGNTVVWVVGVVLVTVLISLWLAQFVNKAFPGRKLVRMTILIPWAASVVMTTLVVYYGLDPFYGIINRALVDIGILESTYGFTRNAMPAFGVSMAIAVFVSLPFTTYTLLAGLQAIPSETLEAAAMDGASPWRAWYSVVLPQLRPALAIATLINIINVFNSLPILRTMTGSIPGYEADTTTTMIFKFIEGQQRVDVASALSIVNFLLVLIVIAVYLRIVKPMKEV